MRLPSICSLGLPSGPSASKWDGQRSPVHNATSASASTQAAPRGPPLVPIPEGPVLRPSGGGGGVIRKKGLRLFLGGRPVCDLPWDVLGPKLADLQFTEGLSEDDPVRKIARGLNDPSQMDPVLGAAPHVRQLMQAVAAKRSPSHSPSPPPATAANEAQDLFQASVAFVNGLGDSPGEPMSVDVVLDATPSSSSSPSLSPSPRRSPRNRRAAPALSLDLPDRDTFTAIPGPLTPRRVLTPSLRSAPYSRPVAAASSPAASSVSSSPTRARHRSHSSFSSASLSIPALSRQSSSSTLRSQLGSEEEQVALSLLSLQSSVSSLPCSPRLGSMPSLGQLPLALSVAHPAALGSAFSLRTPTQKEYTSASLRSATSSPNLRMSSSPGSSPRSSSNVEDGLGQLAPVWRTPKAALTQRRPRTRSLGHSSTGSASGAGQSYEDRIRAVAPEAFGKRGVLTWRENVAVEAGQ